MGAAIPQAWAAVDRTGTGDGICDDGAMTWPPGRPPLAAAVFYVAPGMELDAQEAVLRDAGRVIVDHFR